MQKNLGTGVQEPFQPLLRLYVKTVEGTFPCGSPVPPNREVRVMVKVEESKNFYLPLPNPTKVSSSWLWSIVFFVLS
jgi:hypothetical protein